MNKSIFQILIERFIRAQLNAHDVGKLDKDSIAEKLKLCTCKMLIMTTDENHDETVNFITKQNNCFGLQEDNFIFFP